MHVFFHGKVSLSVNPCLPFDRALCQDLLAALLPTLGRICPRGQSYVVLPQAWVSPYQCLHMVPLFGQDVASVAPFSGRLASPLLLPSCNNKQERREASFIEGRNPFRILGKGTAAWLSPAAMYSVVPAGTKVSEFALGRWEGCDLSHGICLSRARLSASACHKVVTGFRLWRFP